MKHNLNILKVCRWCFLCIVLLFSCLVQSQSNPISLKIGSIAIDDSNPKVRQFTITYSIQNETNTIISFFLKPHTLMANAASSLSLRPVYKIYQNGSFQNIEGLFRNGNVDNEWKKLADLKSTDSTAAKKMMKQIMVDQELKTKKIVDEYKRKGGKNSDELWIVKNQDLLVSQMTMQPKELKTFVYKMVWNKERYFLENDLEYYLDEKDTFEMDITLVLIKDYFKDRLSTEEFSNIAKDKNFIEGVFSSNKVEINFKN
jgi:hypothetical protein